MDLQLDEPQSLTVDQVLRAAVAVPRFSPRTFALITLTLVFPLSFAVLGHTLFTHPILHRLTSSVHGSQDGPQWALLLLYQFTYLLLLFTFSLLSTAAVVFTVASLYTNKSVSFSDIISAVPSIFPRLFRTFLWVSLLLLLYNLAFALALLLLLLLLLNDSSPSSPAFLVPATLLLITFLAAHAYISAWWHLASVVSVLEPLYGLAALSKSRILLRGRTAMAVMFVAGYLTLCGSVSFAFRQLVVKGPDEEGGLGIGAAAKVMIGGVLVAALVVINLVGLLVQSVFYYVCKGFHRQEIDKSALYDHLGGYLGEYVPLKTSIQMETL